MGCVCIDNSADGDLPEFSDSKIVKARKAHVCCECGQHIDIGTKYERVDGKWDGKMRSYATCLICSDIRGAFCCGDWTFGMLWEDIEEQMFRERGLDSACLNELSTVEAKQFLERRWWEWVNK